MSDKILSSKLTLFVVLIILTLAIVIGGYQISDGPSEDGAVLPTLVEIAGPDSSSSSPTASSQDTTVPTSESFTEPGTSAEAGGGDEEELAALPASDLPPAPTPISSSAPLIIPARPEPIPAQIIITFAKDTTEEERSSYITSIGGTVSEEIAELDTVVVNISSLTEITTLPPSEHVSSTEPDYYVSALQSSANDPFYAEQWSLSAIGVASAWQELPAGSPQITIAVIDSGICSNHPDLAGRILPGHDYIDGDDTPEDEFGHGCAMSGVIAANINNELGIAGVAPNTQIMPLRVLDGNGIGSYSDVAAALVYAVDNGAEIISLSLGGVNPSSVLENAVDYADARGVVVIAAAGNSGSEGALYPAAYPPVIAVGSLDINLARSDFSNYGAEIDVYAPGRDMLTTDLGGGYTYRSGTSLSAAFVTGIAAIESARDSLLVIDGGIVRISGIVVVTQPQGDIVHETIACDLDQLEELRQAFLSISEQQTEDAQSVSEEDYQSAASSYISAAESCYLELSINGQLHYDGGGHAPPGSVVLPQFALFGTKWDAEDINGVEYELDIPPSSPGGTVTYSFVPDGLDI
jgi:thermitase